MASFNNEFIDPAIIEFKNFVSNKDAQLVWAARTAARRKALEREENITQKNTLGPITNFSDNAWTITPVLDTAELNKLRADWNKQAVKTAWLVKKAKERLVLEKRFTVAAYIFIGILVAFIAFMAVNSQEKNKQRKCINNMRSIVAAIEEYSFENERLPETTVELSYLVSHDSLSDFGARKKHFRCPSDVDGATSYAINPDILGRSWDELDDKTIVLIDSDNYIFEDLYSIDCRHKNAIFTEPFSLAVYKDGSFGQYNKPKRKQYESIDEAEEIPEAMSSVHYNKCMKMRQQCDRGCKVHRIGTPENMNCSNDCWAQFNRCSQGNGK